MKKVLIFSLMCVFLLSVFPGCNNLNDTGTDKNQTGTNRPDTPRPFDPDAATDSEPGAPLTSLSEV